MSVLGKTSWVVVACSFACSDSPNALPTGVQDGSTDPGVDAGSLDAQQMPVSCPVPSTRVSQPGYLAVDAGRDFACALNSIGEIECWGLGAVPGQSFEQAIPPGGQYERLSLGREFACASDSGGDLVCWGSNEEGERQPPDQVFLDFDLGFASGCGIVERGQPIQPPDAPGRGPIVCWGRNLDDEFGRQRFGGSYSDVAVGRFGFCALDWVRRNASRSIARCFGSWKPMSRTTPDITAVRGLGETACALVHNDPPSPAVCSGLNSIGQADPPTDSFLKVDVAVRGCGIVADSGGRIECWPAFGGVPPDVNGCFEDLAVGDDFVCGLRNDGRIHCWGNERLPEVLSPPG